MTDRANTTERGKSPEKAVDVFGAEVGPIHVRVEELDRPRAEAVAREPSFSALEPPGTPQPVGEHKNIESKLCQAHPVVRALHPRHLSDAKKS